MIILKVKKLDNHAKIPKLATEGSACFDLSSVEDISITTGQLVRARTGLAVEVPKGYCMEILPRSGLASRGIIILNSPGIVDSDYRGEVIVLLYGLCVNRLEMFSRGARIAQARLVRTNPTEIRVTGHLEETTRGAGGFGSTGVEALPDNKNKEAQTIGGV